MFTTPNARLRAALAAAAALLVRGAAAPTSAASPDGIGISFVQDENGADAVQLSFNPDRFVGAVPNPFAWIAFGGGMNRCIGAPFANMEMDVTLRILLREFRFVPTDAPAERRRNRGITIAPRRGGRAVVYRRSARASSTAEPVSMAEHGNGRSGKR